MKDDTKASRCDQRSNTKAELFSFYERRKDPTEFLTDNDFAVAMTNTKKITCKSNELIILVKNWIFEKDINTCVLLLNWNGNARI